MRRCLRVLLCLTSLATAACARAAIKGPEPQAGAQAAETDGPTICLDSCRGARPVGQGLPLYIVDGVPMAELPESLGPADIDSITVIRGADAAALYGSGAVHGAILITTRRASSSQPVP